MRLVFLRLMNRERELEEGYQDILTRGFGGEHPVVARMLVDATARELLDEHLKVCPSCFPARTARLFVDVFHGDTSSAQTGLKALQKTFTNLNQRWLMLDVALAGQDPGLARRLANDFYRQESELEFARSGREDLLMIKLYAGMICQDELLEECGPFLVESTIGHYAIGMWKLSCSSSASEIEEAKRHLAIAADCPVPGLWHVEFAKAYLWLIEDGRLPPTPNPREE